MQLKPYCSIMLFNVLYYLVTSIIFNNIHDLTSVVYACDNTLALAFSIYQLLLEHTVLFDIFLQGFDSSINICTLITYFYCYA